MPLDVNSAATFVDEQNDGKSTESFGPYLFGGHRIFQVWVWIANEESEEPEEDGEWETRFVTQLNNEDPTYFDSFSGFSLWLNELHIKASKEGHGGVIDNGLRVLNNIVAVVVFLAAVAALIYILLHQDFATLSSPILTAFIGIVTAGVGFVFGQKVVSQKSPPSP